MPRLFFRGASGVDAVTVNTEKKAEPGGSSGRPEYSTITHNLHGLGDPSQTGAVDVDMEPDEVLSRNRARNVFFDVLARLFPEVLDELEPLPPEPGKPFPSLSPERARLLDEWLARWHIQADWIRDATYTAMTFWYYHPHERREFQLHSIIVGSPISRRAVRIHLGSPAHESRAAAKRRAYSELQAKFDTAWDAMTKDASAKGFRKSSANHRIFRHTRWLLQHLRKDESCYKISKREKVDIRAVYRTVKQLATLIELPLRS